MSYKLGIVGMGFVGTAVLEGLARYHEVLTYDIDKNVNYERQDLNHTPVDTLRELRGCDIVFICVPTPMNTEDGHCDTSIVENIIMDFNEMADDRLEQKDVILVIKSTITPGFTKYINTQLSNDSVSVIFNPEFLTERNYIDDFKNQNRIVLGGDLNSCDVVGNMYNDVFPGYKPWCLIGDPPTKYVLIDSTTAEMIKYTANTFFATKLTFFNEIYDICQELEIDYDMVVDTVLLDRRIGQSHYTVPGFDGKRGFLGVCFPKDLRALIYTCEQLGLDPSILKATWEKNKKIRPTWEKELYDMKKRALSKEK